MFDLNDPTAVARLIGLLVPLAVALVTKRVASQGLKGVLNALLSAIGGSVAYLVTKDNGYDFEGFVNAVASAFVVSITAYYGVYKPTGLTGSVADATANFGLGPKPVLETDDKGKESAQDSAGVPVPTPADPEAGSTAVDGPPEGSSTSSDGDATDAYEEAPEDVVDPAERRSAGVPEENASDLAGDSLPRR